MTAASLIRERCASLALALRQGVAVDVLTEQECIDLEELLLRLSDRVTRRRVAAAGTDGRRPLRELVVEVLERRGGAMSATMIADELPGTVPSSVSTACMRLWMAGALHRQMSGSSPVYSLSVAG